MTFQQFIDKYKGKWVDFDGSYPGQCVELYHFGKLTKVFFGGNIMNILSLSGSSKISQMNLLIVKHYSRCIRLFKWAIGYLAISLRFRVINIFLLSAYSQIRTAIIKFIAVNMINNHTLRGIHKKSVHSNFLILFILSNIPRSITNTRIVPFKLIKNFKIFFVDYRKLVFSQWYFHIYTITVPYINNK